jgi:hypothetical protein
MKRKVVEEGYEVELTMDLIDQVVQFKGRVWTIYSTTNEGVFAYQGLKPFPSFNYREESQRFSSFRKNIAYIKHGEINILTGEDIPAAVKKEEKEMKKPLSCKKAIEFFVHLTGHSRSFVSKNIEEHFNNSFSFIPGAIRYRLWKHNRGLSSFLILSHNMKGSESHVYYDFITFKTDDIELERSWEEIKQEIIDEYKEWKGIE